MKGKTGKVKGTTKGYPRFQMTESRFLTALYRHDIGKFDLCMAPGPATEMMVANSNLAGYPDNITECPEDLVNSQLVH